MPNIKNVNLTFGITYGISYNLSECQIFSVWLSEK